MDEEVFSLPTLQKAVEAVKSKIDTAGFRTEVVGNLRRRTTLEGGRSGILVTLAYPDEVAALLSQYNPASKQDLWRTTRVVVGNVPVYVFSATEESWGAALIFFTGPIGFKKCICTDARLQGLRLNMNGLWRGKERIAGRSEEQIFMCLGLDYIPPEGRHGYRSKLREELQYEGKSAARAEGCLQGYDVRHVQPKKRGSTRKKRRNRKRVTLLVINHRNGTDASVVEETQDS